jgi:hypothetical protein
LSALRQPSQERYVRFAFAKYRTKEIATPKVDRHAQSGQLAVLKDKSEPHTEVRQLAVLTEESDLRSGGRIVEDERDRVDCGVAGAKGNMFV